MGVPGLDLVYNGIISATASSKYWEKHKTINGTKKTVPKQKKRQMAKQKTQTANKKSKSSPPG